MGRLTDAAVRVSVGLSRRSVAMLAGVDRSTVERYELHPAAVGERHPEKREALAWVYGELRALLAQRPAARRDELIEG